MEIIRIRQGIYAVYDIWFEDSEALYVGSYIDCVNFTRKNQAY